VKGEMEVCELSDWECLYGECEENHKSHEDSKEIHEAVFGHTLDEDTFHIIAVCEIASHSCQLGLGLSLGERGEAGWQVRVTG